MRENSRYSARSAIIVSFAVMFFGFVVWASFTSLDYGVHALGVIKNFYGNVLIQHDATARVSKIAVKEGEMVKKGQVLVELEEADAVATAIRLETEAFLTALRYEIAKAEEKEAESLSFPELPVGILPREILERAKEEANRGYKERMNAYREQMRQFELDIRTAKEQAEKVSEEIVAIDEQTRILEKKISNLKSLEEEGYFPRSSLDEMRIRLSELRRMKAQRLTELGRLKGLIEQTELRRKIFLSEREKEIRGRLAELAPQVKATYDAAKAASLKLKSHVIKAPCDGQVINVKVRSSGTVVGPGMLIMEIVPSDRNYYVEAHVDQQNIHNVHPGMEAEVRFVTLPKKTAPVADGKVESVASNLTVDEKTGLSFYTATIVFTDDVVKAVGIEPVLGMPVQVMMKGGKRSVLGYFVEPLRNFLRKAMREV